MTPFALSGLLAGPFALAFGLLVLFKSANRKLGRIWCLFSFAVGLWGVGSFWIGISTDPATALTAWRWAYLGVVWIPALFFHFVCTFCELNRPKAIVAHYLFSSLYTLLLPTDIFFTSPRLMFDSLYFPQFRWPYLVFVLWWLSFVVYSHVELWIAYRQSNPIKKEQIKYFFLATAIGYSGGSTVYLANFGFHLYPWGNFTVFLYPLIMSYAIIRFNLMDIRVLMRRTALIVFVYVGLLIISAPVFYFFHNANSTSRSSATSILETLTVSLILSTGPFFYAYVVRRKSYFQDYTLAGLTHELKSPLAVIDSALEFLHKNPDLKSVDTTRLAAYIEMIQRNSSRLQVFVNDLLHAMHPARKNHPAVASETFDLVDLIAYSLDDNRNQSNIKSIKIRLLIPDGPVMITGDRAKLQQVFTNAFSNAVKFSDEAGTITIHLSATAQSVTVSIIDTGRGIPSTELPHIFERFYQGTAGRKNKGTGIGLTIAKLWVEAHGGTIWAESEGEGKGTTVSFMLPV